MLYALYIGIFISPIQILVELTEMMQKGLSGLEDSRGGGNRAEIVDAADAKPLKNVKGNVCYEDVSSIIAMMIHCASARSSRYRQENQLRLLDRQEAKD